MVLNSATHNSTPDEATPALQDEVERDQARGVLNIGPLGVRVDASARLDVELVSPSSSGHGPAVGEQKQLRPQGQLEARKHSHMFRTGQKVLQGRLGHEKRNLYDGRHFGSGVFLWLPQELVFSVLTDDVGPARQYPDD